MEFRSHELKNGLQVVAECNPDAVTTAVSFCVNTGSRDEMADVAGASHFLEHMVFKGTPGRSADEVNLCFDRVGAEYNAWTSKENTVYYAVVLPEYQNEIVELWSDLMRPSLRESDFDTEKQVIIEEIRMYEDQPPFGADERVEIAHYGDHPLANRVLGTVESVSALTADMMRGYFQSRYSPSNMVLAAAGNVDFDALVASAEQHCAGWERFAPQRQCPPPREHAGMEVMEKASATQEYVIQLCNAPAAEDERRFAAYLLVSLLGDSSGSRLYWELLHPGHCEQVSTQYHEFDGAGMFVTWLCCEPETTAENLRCIREVYIAAEQEGFSEEELVRAKTKFNSRMVLGSERPQNRMISVGLNWLRRGEYRSVKDDMDAYNAVTADELLAVLKQFPLSKSTAVAVGPLAEL
ncbi:MAG: pitrilysin family protein [Planctomycetota bacterium]|nr:pitrilysin family protein [Planctomycetota bacterium]MEE3218733.1 pitrilysin family protein [Planctomycetota bacterium]